MLLDESVIPSHTPRVKFAISVPDDVFQAVEAQVQKMGISRSQFFADAARQYVEEFALDDRVAEINAVLEATDYDPSEDQAVVRDVMGRIYRELDRINRADNEQAAEALRASGLEFVTPALDEIEGWRERLAVMNRELAEQGLYPVELLEQVETLLASFRDAQTAPADN